MWTIEQAIKHYEVLASRLEDICMKPASEYPKQTAEWLRELVWRRKAPEIIRCGECEFFQCNIRFDGSIPKGADEYECRHWCGGCDPMDYCSYGKRREGRTE